MDFPCSPYFVPADVLFVYHQVGDQFRAHLLLRASSTRSFTHHHQLLYLLLHHKLEYFIFFYALLNLFSLLSHCVGALFILQADSSCFHVQLFWFVFNLACVTSICITLNYWGKHGRNMVIRGIKPAGKQPVAIEIPYFTLLLLRCTTII